MTSLKPGDLVQVGTTEGAAPFLVTGVSEDAERAKIKTIVGDVGRLNEVMAHNLYPWPQGELQEAVRRGLVADANAIVTETKQAITEAAASYVREDPDGAPFVDRMLAEAGCPPRAKRYTASLTVSVTVEFGTAFDETTPALVENSLHISDDEDCIHITHDADLIDMVLAHNVTGIRVQKLEEK